MLSYETQLDLKRDVVVKAYRSYSSLYPSTFLACSNDVMVRSPRVINTYNTSNNSIPTSIWLSHQNHTTFRSPSQKIAKARAICQRGGMAIVVEDRFQPNRQASGDGH